MCSLFALFVEIGGECVCLSSRAQGIGCDTSCISSLRISRTRITLQHSFSISPFLHLLRGQFLVVAFCYGMSSHAGRRGVSGRSAVLEPNLRLVVGPLQCFVTSVSKQLPVGGRGLYIIHVAPLQFARQKLRFGQSSVRMCSRISCRQTTVVVYTQRCTWHCYTFNKAREHSYYSTQREVSVQNLGDLPLFVLYCKRRVAEHVVTCV